jgi:nucleotide-binding universal stress UspA family protein
MFKNILIPTDGSEASQRAAVQGVALAKTMGAKVTGFFAAPPATPIVYRHHLPVGLAQPAEHDQMIEKAASEYLGFIERIAADAGVPFEALHKTDDYPAHAIVEIAGKKGCDLIVMGMHSHGALHDLFIGSVTHKVIHQGKMPVMVVH